MTAGLLANDRFIAYEDFVNKNSDGTPFHTIDWMRVTRDSFRFEALYLSDENENGDIEGVLPLFRVKDLFGSRIVSLPLRDKGGAVFNSIESAERMLDYAIDYAKKSKAGYVHIKTDNPKEAALLEKKAFVKKDEWIISYIKLDKDFNEVKKRFNDSRLNWSINKAERNNLIFQEGETPEDLRKFYSIFLNNRKRLGIPPYPLKFFQNVYHHIIKKGLAKIFFVSNETTVLTTIMVFFIKDKAYDVYSASVSEAYKYRANDFQMFSVIKWLCKNGYREYELGADSKYQENLLNYKRKWGCGQKALHFYYYFNLATDIPVRDSDHPRYRILRKLLQNSPDFLFEKAGSRLIRYLA